MLISAKIEKVEQKYSNYFKVSMLLYNLQLRNFWYSHNELSVIGSQRGYLSRKSVTDKN